MEFGLPICPPLDRPPGPEAVFMWIIHMNWADLPPANEPCKQYKVTLELELNWPVLTSSQLGVNGRRMKHKWLSKHTN